MFGTDTNNQTQSTQTTTMGLSSTMPQVTPPADPAPTISSDTSTSMSPVLTTSSNSESSSTPEFIPPDANGNMTQDVLKATAPNLEVSDDLGTIKKEALEKLGPLVDKLEQTPEEKFKTLMMMIQASDDQSLVSKAYGVANTITDENVKARALLDIINEINYFTSKPEEK